MRKIVVMTVVLLTLVLAGRFVFAHPGPLASFSSSPVTTPTPAISSIPTLTLEPRTLPDGPGDWWKTGQQLVSRFGPWATVGLVILLVFLFFLWKVGEEVVGEEAKGIAAHLRTGARAVWCRLTRRPTPDERAVIKNVRATCERLELKGFVKEHLLIISLESIYVPLMARGARDAGELGAGMPLLRGKEGAGDVPLTDLIARYPRLVLVGEAGSGKTTFLKYVSLAVGDACIGRRADGADWLPDPPPLPLFLPLHGFGLFVAGQKVADRES